ncbi:MAG: UbiA family prenyltransferase [Oligoflexia bacterium]|nr:UbiA family prenyltransferase [Oligoflexia bacterium]
MPAFNENKTEEIEKNKKEIFVVDLDDTLIKTDLLIEGILSSIKTNPLNIFKIARLAVEKDSRHLKIYLANNLQIKSSLLPYRQPVLDLIQDQKNKNPNVPIVLASASHTKWVNDVANYLQIFDEVLATTEKINLKGKNKLKVIHEKFPNCNFTYVGDSHADLPLWEASKKAIAVNVGYFVKRKLSTLNNSKSNNNNIITEFLCDHSWADKIKEILKLIRVHQWSKNLLIFVPMILAHSFFNPYSWVMAFKAFFAFSFVSSCVYVINDLLDVDSDRKRFDRRDRPFASGNLSVLWSIPVLLILFSLILFLLPQINITFTVATLVYFLLTLAYSLKLKKYLLQDIVLLSSFYTIRLYAGGEATATSISEWLLAFSIFFFFGLSLLKRFIEVKNESTNLTRGYCKDDQQILLISGLVSSFSSIVVITLYINSHTVLTMYKHPQYLWFWVILFLYWTNRIWLFGNRGVISSDPVAWVLKDKPSWVVIILILLIMIMAVQ